MSDESTTPESQGVPTLPSPPHRDTLMEIARLFTRLGFTAFGGPAAHIAMFRDEIVTRRKWITDQHFLDLLGAVNLIPGPNSTEMAIHIGFVRGGWRGLLIAGFCFVAPAVLIVLVFAMLYVNYGSTPAAHWLLYGIKPVVIVIIANAVYGLLGSAVKNRLLGAVGVAAFALYLLGINELVLLFGLGLLVMLIVNIHRLRSGGATSMLVPFLPFAAQTVTTTTPNVPVTLELLFLSFLKIGSLLYGGGYVLLAFLRTDFVEWLGWLSNQQLLDAVSVGQFTPGPLFTTATFIGYILAGLPGALLGTLGIFLPSFIFVYITNPFIPRMRKSAWFSALLDGVNVAALGLMAGVTVDLAREALIDPLTIALALIAAVLIIRYKVNTTWLILGGAVVGLGYALLTNQPLA